MFRYYYKDKAISEKDCDEFLDNYKNVEFSSGLIGKENKNVEEDRKAKIHWLEGTNILVRALWSYVLEMNQNFQFNLTGYEKVQLTKYDDDCFYEWHADAYKEDDMPVRKLTAVLQLSKPEDYKGCELQLFNGTKEPEELPIKNQGSIIVFKSDEWHRVTKLTDGIRHSVVMWATGSRLQ